MGHSVAKTKVPVRDLWRSDSQKYEVEAIVIGRGRAFDVLVRRYM